MMGGREADTLSLVAALAELVPALAFLLLYTDRWVAPVPMLLRAGPLYLVVRSLVRLLWLWRTGYRTEPFVLIDAMVADLAASFLGVAYAWFCLFVLLHARAGRGNGRPGARRWDEPDGGSPMGGGGHRG